MAVSEKWREAGQHWKHVATGVATQIKEQTAFGLVHACQRLLKFRRELLSIVAIHAGEAGHKEHGAPSDYRDTSVSQGLIG